MPVIVSDSGLELLECEIPRKSVEDVQRDLVQFVHFGQFRAEDLVLVDGGAVVCGRCIATGPVDGNVPLRVDHARTELDRGDVSLPDRSQTHHEALLAGFQSILVGGSDHRWVAEGRRLDRVLVSEVGPDEVSAFHRERIRGVDVARNEVVVPFENIR